MTGHINTLTAQATIDERHRSAARARNAADIGDAGTSPTRRRRRPALFLAARLARPRVA